MQLKRYTDYSLRVLIYLAVKQGEIVTVNEIARSYNISRHHIAKVVYQLSLGGFIHTVLGKNGGATLKKPPSQINIGDLIRHTEVNLSAFDCNNLTQDCAISEICQLTQILDQATQQFLKVLDQYTLADIVDQNQNALAEVLFTKKGIKDAAK